MIYGYQKYTYNCTNCNGWVARGNNYCKHCGHEFTTQDVDKMIKSSTFFKRWFAPTTPTFDDDYNCTSCNGRIAEDSYCKHCGNEITKYDARVMRGDYKENTVNNFRGSVLFFIIPMLVFLLIFSAL